MNSKDLKEARGNRAAKDEATAGEGKAQCRRKLKSVTLEAGVREPDTKVV
jgi:hypothetical protein